MNFLMNFPCPSAGAKVTNEGYKYPGLSNNLGSDAEENDTESPCSTLNRTTTREAPQHCRSILLTYL